LIIMALTSGTSVTAIARLVAAHEDTVRDVIHLFNEIGLRAFGPRCREAVPAGSTAAQGQVALLTLTVKWPSVVLSRLRSRGELFSTAQAAPTGPLAPPGQPTPRRKLLPASPDLQARRMGEAL
jgi:hypothetical protein